MSGKDKSIRSKMSINEVAGTLEAASLKNVLKDKCKAQTIAIDGACELLRYHMALSVNTYRRLELTMT